MRLVVQSNHQKSVTNSVPLLDNIASLPLNAQELKHRYRDILLMENVCKKLTLPRRTWGIACVLYHRSILNLSQMLERGQLNRSIHAMACVFLGSKADDNPRDLSDHVNLLKNSGVLPENFNEDKIREAIIDAEFLILQNTGFDFEIELPYEYLEESKQSLLQKTNSMAFKKAESFINECFRSDICLYYSPQTLAASALYMACRFLRIDLQEQEKQINMTNSATKTNFQSLKNQVTISTDVSLYDKSLRSINNKLTLNRSINQVSTTNVTPESRDDTKQNHIEVNEQTIKAQRKSFSFNMINNQQDEKNKQKEVTMMIEDPAVSESKQVENMDLEERGVSSHKFIQPQINENKEIKAGQELAKNNCETNQHGFKLITGSKLNSQDISQIRNSKNMGVEVTNTDFSNFGKQSSDDYTFPPGKKIDKSMVKEDTSFIFKIVKLQKTKSSQPRIENGSIETILKIGKTQSTPKTQNNFFDFKLNLNSKEAKNETKQDVTSAVNAGIKTKNVQKATKQAENTQDDENVSNISESSAFLDDSDMEEETQPKETVKNMQQSEKSIEVPITSNQNMKCDNSSNTNNGNSLKNITDSNSSSSFSFGSNESRLQSPSMSPKNSKKNATQERILPLITQCKTPEPPKSTSSKLKNSKGSQSIESTPKNIQFTEMSNLLGKREAYVMDIDYPTESLMQDDETEKLVQDQVLKKVKIVKESQRMKNEGNGNYWWTVFGEEVELETILEISESIYSQLREVKKQLA